MEHNYTREKPLKKRERHNCCVPQCSDVKNETNHLHTVPKNSDRRKAWALAIKTGKALTDTMQVCSKHFKPDDYIPSRGKGLKPNLEKTAVPSLHLPVRSLDRPDPSPLKHKKLARHDRAAKRALWRDNNKEDKQDENEDASLSGLSCHINGEF